MTQSSFPNCPVPLDVTVRFAETDQMRVVHHSVYIIWFEAGRIAWMEAAGLPYTRVSQAGFNFAVTEVHCRYRTAIRFGDPVRVITRLSGLRSRQVAFTYEIRNRETGELHATGHTEHICVDEAGAMARIPAWVVEGLRQGAEELVK
ncbi:MAG: acyl-CoA thioesterase [Caldilineae bacterium]|nr:MAG: acyl-CoA thioesterase [Caldilineae bacterium]